MFGLSDALQSVADNRARLLSGRGDGLVFAGLLLLIVALPLYKGGNRDVVIAVFGAAMSVLLTLWFALFALGLVTLTDRLRACAPIIFLWLLWLLYLVAQQVDWPIEVVREAVPYLASHWPEKAEFMRATVSLGDSRLYLIESYAYFAVFLLVLLTVRGSRRQKAVGLVLVCSGVFQALYGIAVLLSGAKTGFFGEPASPLGAAIGTFVNRNHFACYLALTGSVGIGLVVADLTNRQASNWRARFRNFMDFMLSETVLYRVLVAVLVVALVASRSRMGNIAFFNALAIAGLIYVVLRERELFVKSILMFATFFLVDFMILSNWFGLEQLLTRLENTSVLTETRVDVFPDLMIAAKAYWPFGAGAGSFYAVYPEFRSPEVWTMRYHAHNDYMEFAIETGVFGLALLGGIVSLVMYHALFLLLRRKDRLVGGIAFAGIMSTVFMGVHSTVDFNFQIPANAATYVVILGLVASCSHQRRSRSVGAT